MSLSQVVQPDPFLPLWTCHLVDNAGKEEEGLEKQVKHRPNTSKSQGEGSEMVLFPDRADQERLSGGGAFGAR